MELTQEELSLDLPAKLKETEIALDYLAKNIGTNNIPPEAYEVRSILRRAIYAEEKVKQLLENSGINVELQESARYNVEYPLG